jgi:hypothetical protein
MNRLTNIKAARSLGGSGVVCPPRKSEAAPVTSQAIIADASKVSSRGFLDAVTGRSDAVRAAERQQIIDQCIRAIKRGDTYGFGPALVAEAKQIMAEEDASLIYVERIAPGRVAL